MKYKIILLIITVLSFRAGLQSHPHLFIKPAIEVIKTGTDSAGIKVTWEWDKWWSREVIRECDKNRNGYFDKSEIELVYHEFFSGIKSTGFFTQVYLNGKRGRFDSVNNFSAYISSNDIVTYTFIIPINIDTTGPATVRICFNDETIYAAFDDKVMIIKNNDFELSGFSIKNCGYYGTQVDLNIKRVVP